MSEQGIIDAIVDAIKDSMPMPELIIKTISGVETVYAWRIIDGDIVAYGCTKDECLREYRQIKSEG